MSSPKPFLIATIVLHWCCPVWIRLANLRDKRQRRKDHIYVSILPGS